MFRDMKQVADAPAFGLSAVNGLLDVESRLAELVRTIPYCADHLEVWSPACTQVILDAASQTDSLLKATTKVLQPNPKSRLTIQDHFDNFGQFVTKQKAIFFAADPHCEIWPFETWTQQGSPKWWEAYNALKHDRFSDQTIAQIRHAVDAVAGFFLAIVYSGQCDVAIMAAQLLNASDFNPWAFTETGLLRDVDCRCQAVIETKLFAHPLGIYDQREYQPFISLIGASPRFNLWWTQNRWKLIRPRAAGELMPSPAPPMG